ncbi:MAG: HEAT repeat domain-containing protein [Bdellovibrionota bacterium]
MKSRLRYYIGAFIGFGAIAIVMILWYRRPPVPQGLDWETLNRETLALDEAVLKNPKPPSTALIAALQRQAPLHHPLVAPGLPLWATSSKIEVRQQVAESTRFVSDEVAIPILEVLLKDANASVRSSAIESLGFGNTAKRGELLKKFWSQHSSLSDSETLALNLRLFEISAPSERAPFENKLVELVEKGKDRGVRLRTASRLLSIDPTHRRVRELLENFIDNRARDPELAGQAFRMVLPLPHESRAKASAIESLAHDPSPLFRSAVAQALAAVCIPGSESIFVKLLTESNPSVRATALRSLLEIPRSRAQRILDRAAVQSPALEPTFAALSRESKKLDRQGADCAP